MYVAGRIMASQRCPQSNPWTCEDVTTCSKGALYICIRSWTWRETLGCKIILDCPRGPNLISECLKKKIFLAEVKKRCTLVGFEDGGHGHKPRKEGKPLEAGKTGEWLPFWSLQKDHSPAHTLMLDLQSYKIIHLCFPKVAKFMAISYGSHRKQMQCTYLFSVYSPGALSLVYQPVPSNNSLLFKLPMVGAGLTPLHPAPWRDL